VFRKSGYRFCDENSRKAKTSKKDLAGQAAHEVVIPLVGRKVK
jgi:hypothetical protein